MLMIELVSSHILTAAYALLPETMATPRATAMLLAIGLQESKFQHRRQKPAGPARGFWQFEAMGGVKGVLTHHSTTKQIYEVLATMRYDPGVLTCHRAIEHNDVLAAVFARLLLWTSPQDLPDKGETHQAWEMYLDCWRPGKPHQETWADNFATAWMGLP